MLKFISLGSGSSGNCYYLFTESDGLIIDVGIGVRALKKYFVDYGLSQSKIHHILLTHDHADHVKSVGSLSSSYHLPVYATALTFSGINRNYSIRRKVDPINSHQIENDKTIKLGDFVITPFHVPHDSLDCVGYHIECQGIVFCLLTDVGCITEEIKNNIKDADFLVIEANYDREMLLNGPYSQYLKQRICSGTGHLSNDFCADAIGRYSSQKLRHVWLCHLSQENNHPELARKTIIDGLKKYEKIVGSDFELTVLKRKSPTGIFTLVDE